MINVNGDSFNWRKGLTINAVLKEKKYSFPLIIVKINGIIVEKCDYETYEIEDQSLLEVIHLMSGG